MEKFQGRVEKLEKRSQKQEDRVKISDTPREEFKAPKYGNRELKKLLNARGKPSHY